MYLPILRNSIHFELLTDSEIVAMVENKDIKRFIKLTADQKDAVSLSCQIYGFMRLQSTRPLKVEEAEGLEKKISLLNSLIQEIG